MSENKKNMSNGVKNSLKSFSQNHKVVSVFLSVLASVFMVAGIVAATSIGDSISVTTTLGVTGTSTLAGTSGSYITSTGNLKVDGNSRVGTVDSGTWQGTTVAVAYGGTGATTLTDIVIGNGTSAFTASSTLTVSKGGTGVATFTSTDLLVGNGTGNILSTSTLAVNKGGTGAATLSAGNLLLGNGTGVIQSTSTLTVSKGGSGVTSFTANGVLYGNDTGNVLVTAQGPANSVLTANAGAPVFSANPTVASTSVLGPLNIGTLTATSGTSFINALSLGSALAVASGGTGAATLTSGDLLVGNGTGVVQSTSTLAVNKGGTGQSTYTVGDVLYSNVTNNLAKLGIGTAGQVLMVSNGLPVWAASTTAPINSGTTNRIAVYSSATTLDSSNLIAALGSGSTTIPSNLTVSSIYASSTARITGALTLDTALTVANGGTGVTSLTDGSLLVGAGTGAFTATSTLTVSKGGSGVASFTSNGVLYGNGAGNILVTAQGPANSVLTANDGAPVFSATPTIASTSVLGSFNTGTLTATSGTSFINALSLGTALTVANGGTGAATLTSGSLLVGAGTGAVTATSTVAVNVGGTGVSTFTSNAVLVGNGTGAITTAATSTVGTASSTPSQEFVITGDQAMGSSGTTTLILDSTTATNQACIQLKSTQGPVRAIITIDGTTPSWSLALGSCK